MSKKGLKLTSNLLFKMQQLRVKLLSSDKQDLLLGACIEDGKNAMQDKFIKATMIKKG